MGIALILMVKEDGLHSPGHTTLVRLSNIQISKTTGGHVTIAGHIVDLTQ